MTRTNLFALVAGIAVVGAGLAYALLPNGGPRADPADATLVARGREVYAAHCASCHGASLEGQPDWQRRLPSGRLPAPPHDASGHTWHHPDRVLFEIVKHGVAPFAPAGYESDMPEFADALTDAEIWATLAYIKSTWPAEIRARHAALNAQSR